MVRDFARRRGLGITEAIRVAVEEASKMEGSDVDDLFRRIGPLLEEVRQLKTSGFEETQAEIDRGWHQR
jgi:hypothetical protein